MKKLLIIEDDTILLKMYVNKFKQGDYQIFTATNGRTGINEAIKHHPDFIILDLRIPEIDGIGVLKMLKSTDSVKDIPVAVLTVMQQDLAIKEDSDIIKEAVAYWRKDQVTPLEVFKSVEKFLNQNG